MKKNSKEFYTNQKNTFQMKRFPETITRHGKNFESVIVISIGNVLRLLNDHNSIIAKLFCLVP